MTNPRWFVRIDHLDDSGLEIIGWYKIAADKEFSLYQRPHDGEQQIIANDPPRFMVLDDYNDAQSISKDRIIVGPDNP